MLILPLLLGCAPGVVLGNPVTTAWYQADVECIDGQAVFDVPNPAPLVVYAQQSIVFDDGVRVVNYVMDKTDTGSEGTAYTIPCADDMTFTYMMVVPDDG